MVQAHNTILWSDCINLMQRLAGGPVDFILTDPQYLVRYHDRSGRTIANDADYRFLDRLLRIRGVVWRSTPLKLIFEILKTFGADPIISVDCRIPFCEIATLYC
jgi:site-specific DNA-methyltransferase (adenine-specific)